MHGSFAEFVALPRAERNLCHLPTQVTFAEAAALGCRSTTAYRAVIQRGRLEAGETLAVFGCGGLGLSAVLCAVAVGARVIAVDVNAPARAKAEALGAVASIDATLGAELVRQAVLELTDGIGAGAISLDCP
jgi:alcohol dehydrogenase